VVEVAGVMTSRRGLDSEANECHWWLQVAALAPPLLARLDWYGSEYEIQESGEGAQLVA